MAVKRWLLILMLLPAGVSIGQAALPTHDSEGRELPSLAPMLKEVNPAVVNIATFSHQQSYNPLLNDPFFRHFFNIPDRDYRQAPRKRQQSAGSGVVVDADSGIVLTNYHVIKGADEVQVSLVDGRTFQADIRGVDAELDIAVLEIDAEELTEARLADSNRLQVGDFVVAIGNPFGLGQTVTTGVVSALGRTGLGIEGYENFIQTDASINPGNSGGALVNLHGELIGINTAIIAPAGGNVGIGFAIPINMAESSMAQILRHGKVKRGTVNINVQDITPDLRQAFELANGQHGVLVTDVQAGSSADKAGIKVGDVVVSIDGERTSSVAQWRSQLAVKAIGQQVELGLLREGKAQRLEVAVAAPEQLVVENNSVHPLLIGAKFENSTDGDGVLVAGLAPNSRAAYSGLRPGDLIYAANRRRVDNIQSLVEAVQLNRREILLQIQRGGNSFYLVVR
ncbi:MAG: Do family serine endopeptidase [Cellvibrionaceae bacterium]